MSGLERKTKIEQQEIDYIRIKLERAEQSGFSSDSRRDILRMAKSK